MKPITIVATVYRVAVDHQGSARITFETPLSDLAGVMRSLTTLQKTVRLTIEDHDE